MSTKLYLHNASNALTGTFPTGQKSSITANYTATGANTLRTMNLNIGSSQSSTVGASVATISSQWGFFGFFCSDTLDVNQVIGAGSATIALNIAASESNTNMQFGKTEINVYVWRPSTNSKVGTIGDGTSLGALLGQTVTAASSEQVACDTTTNQGSSSVSALAGDVIIVEIFSRHNQGMATSYSGTYFFDGTTETNTLGTVVTSQASYVLFSDNITFGTPSTTIPNKIYSFNQSVNRASTF